MDDLFYKAGFGVYYIRIDGNHYRRSNSKGWERIDEDKITDPLWSPLRSVQRQVFEKALKEQGLIR